MNHKQIPFTLRAVIQMVVFIILIPLLPLIISGRWDWWEAWAFAIIYILGFVISRVLAAKRHPDLITERAQITHENTQPWDRLLSPLVALGGGLIPLVAGLDALFGWSPAFRLPLKVLALILLLAGYALGSYALMENRFFSGTVRIQNERGHRVISSGPYAWMRHPGYAGAFWSYLASPLILDSRWAFVPAVLLIVLLIIRTRLEDQFLQTSLEGYQEYAKGVRFRLFPGIW